MKRNLQICLTLALLAVTMTSCDWHWHDEPGQDRIVGSWEAAWSSDYYGEYDIIGNDVFWYDFYSDGRGIYTYYDSWGALQYEDFTWDIYGDRLEIYYLYSGTEAFYLDFEGWDTMYLTKGNDYTITFARVR